jgi:glycosyltransferase involved in cell wall biosynthesis
MFVLLVPNLSFGGTERQVTLLALSLHGAGYPVTVATFRPGGVFERQLVAEGVNVVALGRPQTSNPAAFVGALRKLLRASAARALYSFLPAANVIASAAALGVHGTRIVWSVRSADMPLAGYGLKTRGAYALEQLMSGLPDRIVTNSHAGRAACLRKGFPGEKLLVIENGFDTALFHPDSAARARIRAEFGLKEQDLLIGLSGRLDPVKGHETFLHAARSFSDRNAQARFICIGGAGPAEHVAKLLALARDLNVDNRLIWTGDRDDVPKVLNALDIANLCSTSEGFPNVVGEAMACGVPCVVSDVGDAARIVDDTRLVVPVGDPEALRRAWELLSDREERKRIGQIAHARIAENYSLDRFMARTVEALSGD